MVPDGGLAARYDKHAITYRAAVVLSAIGSLPPTAGARKEKGASPTMTAPDIPLRRPTSAGFTFTVMAGD
ncbi:hypothetical protein Aple_083630 [Acrocarpospora pleiomorpha]|uniref:Uncharacterized protein n=1 Tax=Acrocarpospora pleiomorpha TaxID=90975 RepID=A0A5M3XW84_9ACTN|nr:hypothetical protein [Acrocarpospora pleiomorpha]GES25464.1 hypothetical protein Aple_083630 [Acrocarpospora pleiomorpha]